MADQSTGNNGKNSAKSGKRPMTEKQAENLKRGLKPGQSGTLQVDLRTFSPMRSAD